MDYKYFLVSIEDKVATVSMNRPNKANALNHKCWEELGQVFKTLDETKEVRAIVLKGEGKHFCSGIDVSMLMSFNKTDDSDEGRFRESFRLTILWLQDAITAISKCRKPVIAAVHKACIGAGLDIIAACDIRYCSEDAYFVIKETDMGLVADLGSLQRLPYIIGESLTREMAFTGKTINAAFAKDKNLVSEVFDSKEELFVASNNAAKEIASKSPLVIRGIKETMNYRIKRNIDQGLENVANWNSAMIFSDDIKKAIMANVSKEKPDFED